MFLYYLVLGPGLLVLSQAVAWSLMCISVILRVLFFSDTYIPDLQGIHEKVSGDVVSAVCVQRDR